MSREMTKTLIEGVPSVCSSRADLLANVAQDLVYAVDVRPLIFSLQLGGMRRGSMPAIIGFTLIMHFSNTAAAKVPATSLLGAAPKIENFEFPPSAPLIV